MQALHIEIPSPEKTENYVFPLHSTPSKRLFFVPHGGGFLYYQGTGETERDSSSSCTPQEEAQE